jgi:hypothetical protein
MKQKAFLGALWLLPSLALAGNGFYVHALVQAQVDSQGAGADACQYAGASVVRQQITGDVATQVAGPDANDPTRIYTVAGQGSFLLTDAGNQWVNGVSRNQTVMVFFETQAGLHSWTGAAYAGAVSSTVQGADVLAGKMDLPLTLMNRLPAPQLVSATASSVYLSIPASQDSSGLAIGLRIWRQRSDIPGDPWVTVTDMPWSNGPQSLIDSSGLLANQPYTYGVSYIYSWPGGGGGGADPTVSGKYITVTKGLSTTIFASSSQPSPTPFPTLVVAKPTPNLGGEAWVAYPNPLIGSKLYLAFETKVAGTQYWFSAYSLDGTKVLGFQGAASQVGWQAPSIDLGKLASGVYLVRLQTQAPGKDIQALPVRKLAIIK